MKSANIFATGNRSQVSVDKNTVEKYGQHAKHSRPTRTRKHLRHTWLTKKSPEHNRFNVNTEKYRCCRCSSTVNHAIKVPRSAIANKVSIKLMMKTLDQEC